MTACARQAALIRQGRTSARVFTTCPSFVTNSTSIANFMKNVWMAFVGAMIMAVPTGIAPRPAAPMTCRDHMIRNDAAGPLVHQPKRESRIPQERR